MISDLIFNAVGLMLFLALSAAAVKLSLQVYTNILDLRDRRKEAQVVHDPAS